MTKCRYFNPKYDLFQNFTKYSSHLNQANFILKVLLTSKTDTRAISGASWFDAEGHWPSCHTYQGSENVLNMTAIIISSRFDAGWTKHSCCFHKYSIKSAKLQ